jgi:hypothetical protein
MRARLIGVLATGPLTGASPALVAVALLAKRLLAGGSGEVGWVCRAGVEVFAAKSVAVAFEREDSVWQMSRSIIAVAAGSATVSPCKCARPGLTPHAAI